MPKYDKCNDEKLLFTLIKEQYQLGNDHKTTFITVCQKLDYEPLPNRFLKKWLKRMRKKKYNVYCHDEHNKQYYVFMKIYEAYFQFEHAILWDKNGIDKKFKFLPDNPRYGIRCNVENGEFIGLQLIDYYYGEKRSLPFSNNLTIKNIDDSSKFSIYPINTKQILAKENTDNHTNLYLISIEFQKFECELLDSIGDLKLQFYSIVFDELDKQKFVTIIHKIHPTEFNTYDIWATRGQIENGKINLKEEKIKVLDYYAHYNDIEAPKLTGNQLQGLVFSENDPGASIGFWERDLSQEYTFSRPNYSFGVEEKWQGWPYVDSYFWSGHNCYIALKDIYEENVTIEEFNIKTFERKVLVFLFDQEVDDMCLDKDGNLFIKSDNCVYKVPLMESDEPKKPKKLTELIWTQIRKKSILEEKKFYEKSLENLPLNCEYRPFYFDKF